MIWHEPADEDVRIHRSFRRDNGHAMDIAGRPNLDPKRTSVPALRTVAHVGK
jgi:hypothetical protein